MPIRLSGLSSGLDTDTIVSALVSAYSYKKDTITKKQTKLSWTQDAWKSLNTKVYGLYSNVSNLRFSSAYNLKKTTASDTTKATVSADSNAVNGTQKLNILKVAQSGYMTGGKLANGTTTSTTLAELGYTGGDASINIDRGDGTSSTITVSNTSTVNDVINQFKDAGLNASLDTSNGRIFLSAKETGTAADFNLIGVDANGMEALRKLGLSTSLTTTDANGNTVDTATGAAYKKYAGYARGTQNDDGTYEVLTVNDAKANLQAAVDRYTAASDTKTRADAQIANIRSALTYGSAYADTQDFYNTYGIDESAGSTFDKAQFDSVMSLTADGRGKAVIDGSGNTYAQISSKDTDGNTVYSRTDEDGNTSYISREVTYTLDGTTYRKNSDGKYVDVTDEDNVYTGDTTNLVTDENKSVNYYEVSENISFTAKKNGEDVTYNVQSRSVYDDDGNESTEYYFTDEDGNEYTGKSETGRFTYTDADGRKSTLSISKKYEYEQTQSLGSSAYTLASDLYDGYVSDLVDGGYAEIEDEDAAKKALSTFSTNLAKVKAFEKAAGEEDASTAADIRLNASDDDADVYTRSKLLSDIRSAYSSGGGNAVQSYLNGSVSADLSSLSQSSVSAQEAMDDDAAVTELADLQMQITALQNAGVLDDDEQTRLSDLQTQYADKISNLASSAVAAAEALNAGDTIGGATKVDGQDAEIKLNGVTYTGSSNSFAINGLNITAQSVTGDGDDNAITITTATDVQGMYDKIKDFLTEYNTMINEITKLYNADSAKGYEPLTDEEKEAMSDSEVEKWETKIKDSLLRNDGTLGGIMNSMTNAMAGAIEIGGKRYSLSSFGINTLGFLNAAENEHYAYHIDGDEEDTSTSGKADKLMAMLTSDPDTVTEFFQQLSGKLYDALGDKMKSTSLSSIYTIYNDKQMSKDYKDYTSLIKQWEDKISSKEDYYYKKFSSMESSLAKLQSTQNSLSGYFGG